MNFKEAVREDIYTAKECAEIIGYSLVRTRYLLRDILKKHPITHRYCVKKEKLHEWIAEQTKIVKGD